MKQLAIGQGSGKTPIEFLQSRTDNLDELVMPVSTTQSLPQSIVFPENV